MKKQRSKTTNRGVTATSSDINESTGSTVKSISKDGLQSMKEDLQNVIELMGPSTPHLTLTSSEEADNEDSVMETSIYSSVVQVKQTSWKDTKSSTVDTPRDISNLSALPVDSSESVEVNKNVSHNIETCPCRQYYNQIHSNFNNQGVNVNFQPQRNFQSQGSFDMINMQRTVETNKGKSRERVMSFLNLLKFKKHKELPKEPLDLYKINILQASESEPPKRLIFDLVNNLPKPDMTTVATNTSKVRLNSPIPVFYQQQMQQPRMPSSMSNVTLQIQQPEPQKNLPQQQVIHQQFRQEKPTRVDVYYFDHGNSAYLRTTDAPPVLGTDVLAEKTEAYTSKFWAEVFGTVQIPISFLTTFFLQFLRFVLQSLLRPLTVGLTQLASDYFFKPFLTVCFNALIQPPAILVFNILTSLRDLCDPIAEGFGYFLREIANLCRSIRLVEIRNISRHRVTATPLRRARIRRRS